MTPDTHEKEHEPKPHPPESKEEEIRDKPTVAGEEEIREKPPEKPTPKK